MTWRPIDTSPKDGSFIDLWVHDAVRDEGERWADCYWSNGKWWDSDGYPVEFSGLTRATHWMQLPKPPRLTHAMRGNGPQSRLQEIRTARGLTVGALAAATGMNLPTLYRIDTGSRGITAKFRDNLAKALSVTTGCLYEPIGAPI